MTVKPLMHPTSPSIINNPVSKISPAILKRAIPDVFAGVILLILPVIVFWAVWAPNPADRVLFTGDILMQGYPSRFFVHRLFNLGELPLWNPYQLAGMPLLADVQVAVFYLPNLLLDLLYFNYDIPYLAFEGIVVSHYMLGGLFFYAYLRNLEVRPAAALVGAIAFEFNGFFVGHRGHYNMLGVVAWVPGVLWLLDRAWLKSQTLDRSLLWTALAGLALSQVVMAGHPQLTFYSVLFLFAYLCYRWWGSWQGWDEWRQSHWLARLQYPLVRIPLLFGLAGLIAGGIAAVALLPTAELLSRSMRSEPTYTFAASYSLLPRNFITLLIPEFLDWSVTEFRIYAGILTLALAVVAWIVPDKSRPELRFYTIVLIVTTIIAMGGFTIFYGLLYRYVPGFSSVRVSARAFYFANFALAGLAAFGAEVMFQTLKRSELARLVKIIHYGRWGVVLAVIVAIIFYLLLAWNYELPNEPFYTDKLFVPASAEDTFAFLTQTANNYLLFVLFLLASLLLLWARSKEKLMGKGLVVATVILMALDVTTFAPYHDTATGDPEDIYFTIKDFYLELLTEPWKIQDQQQLITQLQALSNPVRVDNQAEVLTDNYSQVWSIPFSTGYNILNLKDRFELQTQWPYLSDTTRWDLLHVGYILTGPDNPDPPEADAQRLMQNSQGSLWQRARQPDYAQFSPSMRLVDDLKTANGYLSSFPQSHQTQPGVSLSDVSLDELLAEPWSQLRDPALYQIGTTGQTSPVDISVLAGGQGGYSAILVNGQTVTSEQRGIIFAVIDPQSGDVLNSGGFDTYLSTVESDRLAATLNSVPAGAIVALTTYDEGTARLTDSVRQALAGLGAQETLRDSFGQAYGLIGVKGSLPGTALEQSSPNPTGLDIGLGAAPSPADMIFESQILTYRPNQISLLVENNVPGLLTFGASLD